MGKSVAKATMKVAKKTMKVAKKKTITMKVAKKKASKQPQRRVKLTDEALAALVLHRPAQGASTKALNADLAGLRPHLGKKCPHFGKRGVLQLAAPASSSDKASSKVLRHAKGSLADKIDAPPRFNKYAGWVEWKNAIFLWLNAAGGNFVNTFSAKGRRVTWYVGGANPTINSPIVGRLLLASKSQAPETNTRVLLFARERASEPYVHCGGVDYISHDPKKKGFEFTFELQDYAQLTKTSDFQRLLDAAKNDGKPTPKQAGKAGKAAARWA